MKKYLLGLFAVVLAIGFSAYTTVNADFEYFVTGTSGSNYVLANPQSDPDCTTSGSEICKVSSTQEESSGLVPISTSTAIGRKD